MPGDLAAAGFYRLFLAELERMDQFLARRVGAPGFVGREDPDVRRLMESVAFFSTRTRQVADQRLRAAVQELAHGHLDDFLTPQPARGLLRATPNSQMVDQHVVPGGTRVRLTNAGGDVGLFTTAFDLVVRPLQIDYAELQPRPGSGYRLLVRIRAQRQVGHVAEPLPLYISYLEEYRPSLRFHGALRDNVQRAMSAGAPGVTVWYDDTPGPMGQGAPGELTFRGPAPHRPGGPVTRIREFFHFPDRDLYISVAMPRPTAPWRTAWLCFELDDWPPDLVVHRDVFRLFVVPIENLMADMALPVEADGTTSSFPIEPSHAERGLALHSVTSVHQETPAGPDPLLPGYLANSDESYDIEHASNHDGELEYRLVLRLPGAFGQPRLVGVDALWYQPWFDTVAVGRLDARLQTRHVGGVEFALQGALTPHKTAALWADASGMLRVLGRRSHRTLGRRDLVYLMDVLGAGGGSHYEGIGDAILHVDHAEEPADLRRGGGVRLVYRVTVDTVDAERQGLLDDYLARLHAFLDSWSSHPVILDVISPSATTAPRRMGGLT